MFRKFSTIILLFLFSAAVSQELNCTVDINTQQIQGTVAKQISEQLKKAVFEFMNNTKWTNHVYTQQERIDCSILVTLRSQSGDDYAGFIQVISSRPVFKSSYKTTLFNYQDEYFQFRFQQFTNLEFNINNFQNNLTSVLAYYAYIILAHDYDSFAPQGGTEYWQKAQLIVNNAQGAVEQGWKSSEGNGKNRYWLVENQLQPVFSGIRDCMYKYHRDGLDIMAEKVEDGRANVYKALELLVPVYTNRPASFNMQLFFNAKGDEIVNAFKGAMPDEKAKAVELLMKLDPANTTKYLKIQEN
jgi:hypothetical protein